MSFVHITTFRPRWSAVVFDEVRTCVMQIRGDHYQSHLRSSPFDIPTLQECLRLIFIARDAERELLLTRSA